MNKIYLYHSMMTFNKYKITGEVSTRRMSNKYKYLPTG